MIYDITKFLQSLNLMSFIILINNNPEIFKSLYLFVNIFKLMWLVVMNLT